MGQPELDPNKLEKLGQMVVVALLFKLGRYPQM